MTTAAALDRADRLAAIMAPPPPPKVYSYARWSTPEQANGDSFRRQSEAAAKWAERNGLVLDTKLAIRDDGVSAYRGTNSTDGGLSRFLEACRRGLIEPGSVLLVESLDRISRMTPRKAQRLFDDIVDSGVTIVTLNDGQSYTSERLDEDPTALLIALMVCWRSHEESKTKGRRVAAAWAEKRKKLRAEPARRMTSRAPAWLVPDGDGWALHPTRAPIVKRVFDMTLAGSGEHLIAATFNREGVPVMGRGRMWHRSTISKILRSPAAIGTLVPGRMVLEKGKMRRRLEDAVPGAFPAVISEELWVAVRAMKDGTSRSVRGRNASRGAAHVFAGLAKCPLCGASMTRVSKGSAAKGGHPKLVCTVAKAGAGCRYVSVPVHLVEEAFSAQWIRLIADVPAGSDGVLDSAYERLEANISGTEDLLHELVEQLDRSPSSTGVSRVARLEAELRLMEAERGELDERRRIADGGLIRARIDALHSLLDPPEGEESGTVQAINAALRTAFKSAVIDYAHGIVRLEWRQGGHTELRYAWTD